MNGRTEIVDIFRLELKENYILVTVVPSIISHHRIFAESWHIHSLKIKSDNILVNSQLLYDISRLVYKSR